MKAIITVLDEQHSRTIYLPFYANFTPVLSLLPSYLRDFAQWVSRLYPLLRPSLTYAQFTSADYAMDGFVKVSGRREDEGPVPNLAHRSKSE